MSGRSAECALTEGGEDAASRVLEPHPRRVLRWGRAFGTYATVAAVVALPLAAERAVETASFRDRVGTFPVEVTLQHNGATTLDTGLLGEIHWRHTGFGGFGVHLRSTGPPAAEGTLSSYVTPRFLRANAAFVQSPSDVAEVYGVELRAQIVSALLRYELAAALGGGLLLSLLFRGSAAPVPSSLRSRWWQWGARAGYVVAIAGVTTAVSWQLFGHWVGSRPIGVSYSMPGAEEFSFSSPQTREVAEQIRPFIEKNTGRIAERSAQFEATASGNLQSELPGHAAALEPREGERVVISEADPQGSLVATKVRRGLYALLQKLLGEDVIAMRTVAGDLTSNGTVAERGFLSDEVSASQDIPTVVVKGDHDSRTTVDQLRDEDVTTLDLDVDEVGGIEVAGAADPAFKALFGGLVNNPTGVTEAELGQSLRTVVDERDNATGVDVIVHQPRAAVVDLGVESTSDLAVTLGHETVPYDDGIPDVPPGMVNFGHLHDVGGPWVIWNTDGDEVTWTVVSQLGTSGGVEENPTFNRFSTPFSVPLKAISVRLAYVNPKTGLQTGYASIVISPDGSVTVEDRVDVGLPGGEPGPAQ
jgi:Icc-related predicted phosphoesterase